MHHELLALKPKTSKQAWNNDHMLDIKRFMDIKASGNLPSPQGVALKVMQLCQQEDVSLPELVKVLQSDPAMTVRLLKLANSPVYSRRRPAASLTADVLISIGIESIKQVVLTFSLISNYRNGSCTAFNYNQFWLRSIAMGIATQQLGAMSRIAPPSELFTLGLLADVGRLAMAQLYPSEYNHLIREAGQNESEDTISQLEARTFGFAHPEVSVALMCDWGLPKLYCEAVESFRHMPVDAIVPNDVNRARRLAALLNLSWATSSLCFHHSEEERNQGFVHGRQLAESFGVPAKNYLVVADSILDEWSSWAQELQIPVQEHEPLSTVFAHDDSGLIPSGEKELYSGETFTYLVVDENVESRTALVTTLNEISQVAHASGTGTDALIKSLQVQPDIVLLDVVQKNQQDGYKLIQSLRSTEFGRQMYIIVLTDLHDDEHLTHVFDAGADDCLEKPLHPRVLNARLKAGQRFVRERRYLHGEQEGLRRRLLEISVARKRAEESAFTDDLTGLPNRRHLLKSLAHEWAKSARKHRPLTLLMIDLDRFKEINDRYGHEVGDAVLCAAANRMTVLLRSDDFAGRFGGEEFLTILPDTTAKGAIQLAERILLGISEKPFEVGKLNLNVTVSIGIASKLPSMSDLNELIHSADMALYEAKNAGRNRLTVADSSLLN